MALQAGDRLAERYRVLRSLGRGGMARVFLVEEERSGQKRVLKQLHIEGSELLQAFRAEFALLAQLSHPHLTRVLDFGAWRVRGELHHYYTAEWIEAKTLAEHASDPGADFVRPWLDALSGLSALHELGVRHGDFTPENVLVSANGRGLLIDLGCARPLGHPSSEISGTPGFIAPEVLASGAGDARADLFSAGVALRRCHEQLERTPSPTLRRLIERLTAADPGRRPSSVSEVCDELGQHGARASEWAWLAPRLLGREREIAAFHSFTAALCAGRAGPRVLSFHAPPGGGLTRLLRELAAQAELELPVLRAEASEHAAVSWLLGAAVGVRDLGHAARDALSAAELLVERGEPLLLFVEDAHRLDGEQRELLLAFARSLPDDGPVGLVLGEAGEGIGAGAFAVVELAPLDLSALSIWTRGALPQGRLAGLHAKTLGLPARIEAELERLHLARRAGSASRAPVPAAAKVLALDEGTRELLALLVVQGGELDLDEWGVPSDRAASPELAPWIRRDRARLRLRDRSDLEAIRAQLPAEVLARAHGQVAVALKSAGGADASREARLVRHLALSGARAAAEERLHLVAPLALEEPAPFVAELGPLLTREFSATAKLFVAELALAATEPALALAACAGVLRARPAAPMRVNARLLAASALLRLGRGERAERLAERALEGTTEPEAQARAWVARARARLQRQDPSAAEQAAASGLALGPSRAVEAELFEVLGLAVGYQARPAEAEAAFARALERSGAELPARDRCRLLGQRAIVAFRAGRVGQAVEEHAEAVALAERYAIDDLLAVSLLNLGTAEQQSGDLGSALKSFRRGLKVARAIGRESTELTLLYNLANLQFELGDLAGAERELGTLERRASPPVLARFTPVIALLRTELLLARGELESGARSLDRAGELFAERGLARELVEVEICRAEVELLAASAHDAAERARRAEQRARELGAEDLLLRALGLRARALLTLSDGSGVALFEDALARAASGGLRLLEAKLAGDLALHLLAIDHPSASERVERARRLWDRLAANLPATEREAFWSDPRRAPLSRRTEQRATAAGGGDAATLRRLLALSRRLNSTLTLERVLDYAIGAAVELTGAERGFLMLNQADGEPAVAAEHPASSLADPPSRSIVARVVREEEPLLTTDAQSDERFRGQGSIHALRLKSVLCVPISTPAERLGALYVDSRVQRTRFGAADKEVLIALADQIAVAVTNARLHAELSRRSLQVEEQNKKLERMAREKERELERLRERVEEQALMIGRRYDYSNIIGKSPPMQRLFAQLDRITASEVNVLIQGESGTGKELVARAVHGNGPRGQRAFVAVNCAALPDTLLESELFGHQRGAFTGADRDKLGLMRSADGGTLFLDEIGEMSLVTQAKLLRVLQEREVRPLGSSRSVRIDIRLIAATHRDLVGDVQSGRFREDLYYRIAVVNLALPPLRERVEDLAELAERILERLAEAASRPAPKLAPDALRLLATHPFPGNVRELENILTRAFVLGSGPRIAAGDIGLLPPARRRASGASRAEFESEERARIIETLHAVRWNVSEASRLLGVPRNTLYRKLARYGVGRGAASAS